MPITTCIARTAATVAWLAAPAAPALALDILLCNDDGITAANVRALKRAS